MKITGKYILDNNLLLEKSYDLLCTFFANKEIAYRSDPDDISNPIASLEQLFFESKVTKLLIEIATLLRVLDDQMHNLPANDSKKGKYFNKVSSINKIEFGLFQEKEWNFRDVCNKIIHSTIFEPSFSLASEGHRSDYAYNEGYGPKKIEWKHFNGYVRLKGKDNQGEWIILLDIEIFVGAIYKLIINLK